MARTKFGPSVLLWKREIEREHDGERIRSVETLVIIISRGIEEHTVSHRQKRLQESGDTSFSDLAGYYVPYGKRFSVGG